LSALTPTTGVITSMIADDVNRPIFAVAFLQQ
jgi:hypothetical protein